MAIQQHMFISADKRRGLHSGGSRPLPPYGNWIGGRDGCLRGEQHTGLSSASHGTPFIPIGDKQGDDVQGSENKVSKIATRGERPGRRVQFH